jgi:hypothetical protein
MGYMLVFGHCFGCGKPFGFNPELVPSIPILPDGSVGVGGDRKPICESCITLANHRRIADGLPPWDIPPGAYEPTESI